jgi:hypothetical protein
VSAETSESLMSPLQERRPAIWPWLVMPLATLALYYGLHYGLRHERLLDDLAPGSVHSGRTESPTGSDTP